MRADLEPTLGRRRVWACDGSSTGLDPCGGVPYLHAVIEQTVILAQLARGKEGAASDIVFHVMKVTLLSIDPSCDRGSKI